MISLIASIPLSLKFGIPQRQICLFHTLSYPWHLTVRGGNHLSRKYIIMSYPLFKVRYQWNPDRNHKLCNIVYSMCRCSWNVATVATITWLTAMEYLCHKWSREHFPVYFSLMTYHRVGNKIITTSVTSGAGTVCCSGTPEMFKRKRTKAQTHIYKALNRQLILESRKLH
jgi:hypothetical protein